MNTLNYTREKKRNMNKILAGKPEGVYLER
jgi:hypothetical protein